MTVHRSAQTHGPACDLDQLFRHRVNFIDVANLTHFRKASFRRMRGERAQAGRR